MAHLGDQDADHHCGRNSGRPASRSNKEASSATILGAVRTRSWKEWLLGVVAERCGSDHPLVASDLERLTNQKREWYQQQRKLSERGSDGGEEAFIEHFLVVGLHPGTDLTAVEEASLHDFKNRNQVKGPKEEGSSRLPSSLLHAAGSGSIDSSRSSICSTCSSSGCSNSSSSSGDSSCRPVNRPSMYEPSSGVGVYPGPSSTSCTSLASTSGGGLKVESPNGSNHGQRHVADAVLAGGNKVMGGAYDNRGSIASSLGRVASSATRLTSRFSSLFRDSLVAGNTPRDSFSGMMGWRACGEAGTNAAAGSRSSSVSWVVKARESAATAAATAASAAAAAASLAAASAASLARLETKELVDCETDGEEEMAQDESSKVQLEPQLLFKFPPGKKLALSPSDLPGFCFPNGIKATVLRRSPSMSDLHRVIFGQAYQRSDNSAFVFLLKVANNTTLYGVCMVVEEIVQRPPGVLAVAGDGAVWRDADDADAPTHMHGGRDMALEEGGVQGEEMDAGGYGGGRGRALRCVVTAPRCYCILSRVPCIELHFEVLRSVLVQERLDRIKQHSGTMAMSRGLSTSTSNRVSRTASMNAPSMRGRTDGTAAAAAGAAGAATGAATGAGRCGAAGGGPVAKGSSGLVRAKSRFCEEDVAAWREEKGEGGEAPATAACSSETRRVLEDGRGDSRRGPRSRHVANGNETVVQGGKQGSHRGIAELHGGPQLHLNTAATGAHPAACTRSSSRSYAPEGEERRARLEGAAAAGGCGVLNAGLAAGKGESGRKGARGGGPPGMIRVRSVRLAGSGIGGLRNAFPAAPAAAEADSSANSENDLNEDSSEGSDDGSEKRGRRRRRGGEEAGIALDVVGRGKLPTTVSELACAAGEGGREGDGEAEGEAEAEPGAEGDGEKREEGEEDGERMTSSELAYDEEERLLREVADILNLWEKRGERGSAGGSREEAAGGEESEAQDWTAGGGRSAGNGADGEAERRETGEEEKGRRLLEGGRGRIREGNAGEDWSSGEHGSGRSSGSSSNSTSTNMRPLDWSRRMRRSTSLASKVKKAWRSVGEGGGLEAGKWRGKIVQVARGVVDNGSRYNADGSARGDRARGKASAEDGAGWREWEEWGWESASTRNGRGERCESAREGGKATSGNVFSGLPGLFRNLTTTDARQGEVEGGECGGGSAAGRCECEGGCREVCEVSEPHGQGGAEECGEVCPGEEDSVEQEEREMVREMGGHGALAGGDYGAAAVEEWARQHGNDSLRIVCAYHCLPLPPPAQPIVFHPLPHHQPIVYSRPILPLPRSLHPLSTSSSSPCSPSSHPTLPSSLLFLHMPAVVAEHQANLEEALGFSPFSIISLCRCLSLDNVLLVLAAVLLEKQLVVICPNMSLLSSAVLAIVPLIRPFIWQSALLPVLPSQLLPFLDAPVPFVVGLQAPMACVRERTSSLVIVNLAKNKVSLPCDLPLLPEHQDLAACLLPHHSAMAGDADAATRLVFRTTPEQARAAEHFQASLVAYFQSFCASIRSYTVTAIGTTGERVPVLLKDAFVNSFSPKSQPFFKLFFETQMFSVHSDKLLAFPEMGAKPNFGEASGL
ncbi:hypothetical protein CLOP_g11976 [Closterium sp. NIES-67]|nr:hypothetical protein CLOP_g11976 [Closterium sp. NIES-67]